LREKGNEIMIEKEEEIKNPQKRRNKQAKRESKKGGIERIRKEKEKEKEEKLKRL
jgi:hypothetical protein